MLRSWSNLFLNSSKWWISLILIDWSLFVTMFISTPKTRFPKTFKDRSSHRRRSVEIAFLRDFAKKQNIYARAFFNKVASLRPATLLKDRLWHSCFFCEFCETCKNTCSTKHFQTTASVKSPNNLVIL